MSLVIDAHQHFWDPARADYPWMQGDEMAVIRRAFGPSDLAPLLAQNGVDASIVVQCRSSLEETEEFLRTAHATPSVVGVVGWAEVSTIHRWAILSRGYAPCPAARSWSASVTRCMTKPMPIDKCGHSAWRVSDRICGGIFFVGIVNQPMNGSNPAGSMCRGRETVDHLQKGCQIQIVRCDNYEALFLLSNDFECELLPEDIKF